MSETDPIGSQEISPDQKIIFVDKVKELVPTLEPTALPGTLEALEAARIGEMSEDTVIWMVGKIRHKLGEQSIGVEYGECEEISEAYVSVGEQTVDTREGISVGYSDFYRVNGNGTSSFRRVLGLFKGKDFSSFDALREIFTEKYLQPIEEEHARLEAVVSGPDAHIFTVERFLDLIPLLDQLGPNTVADDQF